MSQAEFLAALPEAQRKHLDPSSPLPMRMMAAKGMAPLPPREMVLVQAGLSLDADEKISTAATTSLRKLPEKILVPVLDGELPSAALDQLIRVIAAEAGEELDPIVERLVLNRQTSDDAIASIAASASAHIAEIIVGNQERCSRSHAIVDAVRQNPNVLKSSLDRLFDFLARAGVAYEGMEEIGQAMARLTPSELADVAGKVDLPEQLQDHLAADTGESDAKAEAIAATLDDTEVDFTQHEERIPVLKLIAGLTVAQKIALAQRGNKEVRTILIRETNKLIASTTIRSPRITEPELVAAAQSRSVSDEVIRIISRSKEMTQSYQVKKALVCNPKTPQSSALRLLGLLRAHDLRQIGKSRNVPPAVATQARRLVQRKK